MNGDAKPYFTSLPARGLIHVEGDERVSFLQGLVTADVWKLAQAKILYSCLLTAQGKFLHDFFMIHGDGCILIDCEGGERAEDLYRRLKLYRLRAKVGLSVEQNHPVYALPAGGLPDPRHSVLPRRTFEKPAGAIERPFADWDAARIRLGVPDGSRDMAVERDTPLDCGLDRFGAISFTKGCYVGQEVTARMNYRGLVKKHLYPVEWQETDPPAPFTDIFVGGVLAGQMRSCCGASGLALLRDEFAANPQGASFRILQPAQI